MAKGHLHHLCGHEDGPLWENQGLGLGVCGAHKLLCLRVTGARPPAAGSCRHCWTPCILVATASRPSAMLLPRAPLSDWRGQATIKHVMRTRARAHGSLRSRVQIWCLAVSEGAVSLVQELEGQDT